jgi:hypothetical protein
LDRRRAAGLLAVALAALVAVRVEQALGGILALAENHTAADDCAEVDNVNVPLFSRGNSEPISSYVIEARHPKYEFDEDFTEAVWTGWDDPEQEDFRFKHPGRFTIYDDGVTAVIAVRKAKWWRPHGMTAIGEQDTVLDAHRVVVHRRIGREYPEVLVLYQDGNLRLKPLPRVDQPGGVNAFGSSVVVGPAPTSDRPIAEVSAVQYLRDSNSLEIIYCSGESANLRLDAVTRESTRVEVKVNYATSPGVAFATIRSMYLADDNADVERVAWTGADRQLGDQHVTAFGRVQGSEFLFKRDTVSTKHNTSAPDIWIGNFESASTRRPTMVFLLPALAALGVLAFCLRSRRGKGVAD